MHQDQGDASHVSIRVRIWEIVHIRAFGPRDRIVQVNQEVTEASKVTPNMVGSPLGPNLRKPSV